MDSTDRQVRGTWRQRVLPPRTAGEGASRKAIETAATTLRDLRIAEAHRFDVTIEDGKVKTYRVRLDVSFKYGSDVTGAEGDQAEEWEHTRHELQ